MAAICLPESETDNKLCCGRGADWAGDIYLWEVLPLTGGHGAMKTARVL